MSFFRGKAIGKLCLFLLLLPIYLKAHLAQELLEQMTLDEKIGQLLMVPACPKRGERHFKDWEHLLEQFHIGNAIVKQSDPIAQIQFLNRLQKRSKLPLLIAADAEWGLGMRMEETLSFPKNQELGKIDDLSLIERLGWIIGTQASLVGIHLNLAPVVDVKSNPNNQIIGVRSFGEDPLQVGNRAAAWIKGHEKAFVMSCAKHFPGHGDTETDTHLDLAVVSREMPELKMVELLPFQKAIDANVSCIMLAHLLVSAVDPIYPSSLSLKWVQILREELGFDGLVITDALNMKALEKNYSIEEIAVLARKAGADLLLYGDHIAPNVDRIIRRTIPRVFSALKKAYLKNELDRDELNQSLLRILKAKEKIKRFTNCEKVQQKLFSKEALDLKEEIIQRIENKNLQCESVN